VTVAELLDVDKGSRGVVDVNISVPLRYGHSSVFIAGGV